MAGKLCIPVRALDQHGVVLGKTGAGKSSALRHIVEHLIAEDKRVCVIDPKGDWWGIKASADGKGPGLPIVTFGDFKNEDASDVPVNAQSGKHVAELLATGNRPAIIGFRGWMTSHMVQFWIDFASQIFRENQGELYLIIDEVHNFAPKGKIMDPQAGKCLHWTNRLMSEGRGLGIVAWIASQRPQKVHNDTLTSCETLVAMRVIHAADRDAIAEWIKGCGEKELGTQILNAVAGLPRGEAYVWSPEIGFGPKRIKFPMFETFDSFAPPQLQKKVSRRTWADVDLDAVRHKLAAVIEEAKANDPKELRAQVATLRRETETLRRKLETKKTETETIEIPVLKESDFTRLGKFENHLENELMLLRQKLSEAKRAGSSRVEQPTSRPGALRSAEPSSRRVEGSSPSLPSSVNGRALAPRHQEIVNAIAFYNEIGVEHCDKNQIAGFVLRPFNGGFRTDLSILRTQGLIEYPTPGDVMLTEEGNKAVTELPRISTQSDLHNLWLRRLAPRHVEILSALLTLRRGEKLEKAELAGKINRAFNGGFRTDLSILRTLGTIDYPSPGTVCVSDNLYPPIPAS